MYAYCLAGICLISALLLIFRMGKEQKLYIALGIFLLLFGAWTAADQYTDKALSGSWVVWIQRAVLLVAIILLIVIMKKDIAASKARAVGGEELLSAEDPEEDVADEEDAPADGEAQTSDEEEAADR